MLRPSRSDILYVEDTMLVHHDPAMLQSVLKQIVEIGGRFGLEMHRGKVDLLRVCNGGQIINPNGMKVKVVPQATYLGYPYLPGRLTRSGTKSSLEAHMFTEDTGALDFRGLLATQSALCPGDDTADKSRAPAPQQLSS